MSWSSFFGSSSSREKYVPALNALEQQRLKQIESLRRCHPSLTEVKKDTEYKITIFIKDEALNLHVYLPPNFPNEIPVVTVSPAVTHPWVNDQMIIIGCDSLNNFYMHSNLGRALQDVCKQFFENPPTFCQYTNIGSLSSSECREPAAETLVELNQDSNRSPPSSFPVQTHVDGLSKISMQLDSCSIEELRELENNSDKLMELILSIDFTHTSTIAREDQVAKIEQIARENVEERRPRLEAARDRLLAKYEELSIAREKFDQWSLKQNELFEMYARRKVHTDLQIAAAKADEESETIAEEFLNEKIEIEEFIKKFLNKRKLTHLRHWKEENVLKL